MAEEKTREDMPVWTWEMFEPGIESPPMTMPVTRESIANYAKSVLNNNPIYFDDEAAKAEGYDGVFAAPTMVFAYAPMQRWEMFNSLGYLSPEQTSEPRSTPVCGRGDRFPGGSRLRRRRGDKRYIRSPHVGKPLRQQVRIVPRGGAQPAR